MVEGPGATRNGRKLQPAVSCCVVPLEEQQQASQWIGLTLVEAFSVGKEVFLVFSNETAMRLHFGMNGSLALSRNGKPIVRRYAKRQPASLKMKLLSPDDSHWFLLECHATTVNQVSANVARSKRERLQSLDACGDLFDPQLVQAAIRKRPTAMICDAVLDQNKFPGVGNIIKIEGLHQAKIHPKRLVSGLSNLELHSAILKCRHYAMGWLKGGRAPTKKVYNETTCKSCQTFGSVRMVKLGNDLSRVTFWCDRCQPLQPEATTPYDSIRQRPLQHAKSCPSNDKTTTKPPPGCPQHGSRSYCLRRVRHKEQNKNRLFATCNIKGCPYFAWADTHLPDCPKCRKKSILRVSKKEQSSGRWFLSCSANCSGIFAWAAPQQLAPFGKFLTPLL